MRGPPPCLQGAHRAGRELGPPPNQLATRMAGWRRGRTDGRPAPQQEIRHAAGEDSLLPCRQASLTVGGLAALLAGLLACWQDGRVDRLVGCSPNLLATHGNGRMQVVVMASRKGGAGKTTLACHLAVEAQRVGNGPVAIVDTDPMAGLSAWWDVRKSESPILVRAEPDLETALEALTRNGIKLVFIDTPPAIVGVADTIAFADLVVVPVQPSPDDLRAVGITVELVVDRVKKPLIFVINRTKPRVRLTGEAAIALSQYGTVAPVNLADRTDYAAAKIDGLTAPEVDPLGRAADEIAGLWTYIGRRLGVTNEQAASVVA